VFIHSLLCLHTPGHSLLLCLKKPKHKKSIKFDVNNKYLIMNHEELMQTLKEMSFKALLNAYLEAYTGKPFDMVEDLNSSDKQLVEDLDSVIFMEVVRFNGGTGSEYFH